jgi:type IV secretory pathway TrbL component
MLAPNVFAKYGIHAGTSYVATTTTRWLSSPAAVKAARQMRATRSRFVGYETANKSNRQAERQGIV